MGHSKYKLLITLLATLVITSGMNYAQGTKESQQEQTFFPSDPPDEVFIHKPITLSDKAIQTLRSSEAGLDCLEIQHQFDAAWVVGSIIHLSSAGETDIVVMPKFFKDSRPNYCMLGNRVTTFWVLRKGDKGYQLLFETKASALSVENTRHNGYLNITAYIVNFSDTDAVYYRFDGKRYQEFERKVIDKR